MASHQGKWISIMIVPEDGTVMRKWRITNRKFSLMKVALGFICFFLFLGLVSMIALGLMYENLRKYKQANLELLKATYKLNSIASRLESYEQKELKLRAILGSDLNLPQPKIIEQESDEFPVRVTALGGGLYELEQKIKENEAQTRRIPTMWPVNPWQITKKFSKTNNGQYDHDGIDIITSKKSSVVAAAEGMVTFADYDTNRGLLIEIDHGNGWITKYGHNAILLVNSGDYVQKGQQIAVFGGSGESSTGPHLHFGMYYNGSPVNPLDWLEKKYLPLSQK